MPLMKRLIFPIALICVTLCNCSCSLFFPEQLLIINDTGERLESVHIQSLYGYKKEIKDLAKDKSIAISSSDMRVFLDSYTLTWKFNDGTIRKGSVDLLEKARYYRKKHEDEHKRTYGYSMSRKAKANYEFQLFLTNRNFVKVKMDRHYYSE